MRNEDYQFINVDTNSLISELITAYEQEAGITVRPASPERLLISWLADVIIQERVLNNYTGNQNIPSRAEGENLDALGEIFYNEERPPEQAAISTQRFYISEPQNSAILIPEGTRVTDVDSELVWATTADAYIDIGNDYVDVMIQCQEEGVIGNGYAPGQINTLIDLYPYYDRCENITESDDGADAATDEEFYALLKASKDAFSTAGPKGAYFYFAKQVSTQIEDVVVNSPEPGQVNIYVLMNDGSIAGSEIKNAVYSACNDDYVRPLTDYLVIDDAETVSYDIELTYYIPRNTTLGAGEIESAVSRAIEEYTKWQSGKLGRDINPSYLHGLLMQTGIKRAEIVAPSFTTLRDGNDNAVPQVASIENISITNGGYEDE